MCQREVADLDPRSKFVALALASCSSAATRSETKDAPFTIPDGITAETRKRYEMLAERVKTTQDRQAKDLERYTQEYDVATPRPCLSVACHRW